MNHELMTDDHGNYELIEINRGINCSTFDDWLPPISNISFSMILILEKQTKKSEEQLIHECKNPQFNYNNIHITENREDLFSIFLYVILLLVTRYNSDYFLPHAALHVETDLLSKRFTIFLFGGLFTQKRKRLLIMLMHHQHA